MHAHYPLKGVIYPPEADLTASLAAGTVLNKTAGDLIREQARLLATKPMLVSDEGVISYVEFHRQTEILAAALLDMGLEPGDRALFQMGTTEETLVALFACYKAGIVPVCTLAQYREHEISTMIRLSEPRAYFVQQDYSATFDLVDFARGMASTCGHVEHVIPTGDGKGSIAQLANSMSEEDATAVTDRVRPNPYDVLTFQLSGGSTGVPKIIPRFHGEYLGQANGMVSRHKLSRDDVALWPLPLIHNAAMILMVLPVVLAGGTLVLQQRFHKDDFLDAIEAHKVTYAGSIGPIAQSLLDDPALSRRNLSSVRAFFVLNRADALERHVKIPTMNLYGITEGLLMTSSPDDPAPMRLACTGYPTGSQDEIQILEIGDDETIVESGEGELCFRGPHMIRGYYNAPELNASAFTSNGYLRTGDIVRVETFDDATTYTFVGRLKDNISRGGEKFSTAEVEDMIVQHPAVVDAKVVAMPDRLLGEKACAFLIVRRGHACPSVGALSEFLQNCGLARYKHPERIEVADEFPVTRVGKVDKLAMRALIARTLEDEARTGPGVDLLVTERS